MNEKIIRVLSNILNKTTEEILNLDKRHERYWDSLQAIEIVFCLEQEFGVSIESDDIPLLKSISSIEEVISRLLKKNS